MLGVRWMFFKQTLMYKNIRSCMYYALCLCAIIGIFAIITGANYVIMPMLFVPDSIFQHIVVSCVMALTELLVTALLAMIIAATIITYINCAKTYTAVTKSAYEYIPTQV